MVDVRPVSGVWNEIQHNYAKTSLVGLTVLLVLKTKFFIVICVFFLFAFVSRHCGRMLCNRCSSNDVPILKFGMDRPVRVCCVCFEVLQIGGA